MSKTELWDKLGVTDPSHTKPFKRAGGFSGTAIKPMWSYRRMTEEFGPCGSGWGVNEPSFQVVSAGEEVLVYCTVSIWYDGSVTSVGSEVQSVFGVGGDKVYSKTKHGMFSDDEAFKKAYTDAVTNALKMIGVGADVHMGMFDDNKYVNTQEDPLADAPRPVQPPKNDAARKEYTGLKENMRLNKTQQDLMRWWKDPDVVAWRLKLTDDWQKALKREVGEYGDTLPTVDDVVKDIQEAFPGATVKSDKFVEDFIDGK